MRKAPTKRAVVLRPASIRSATLPAKAAPQLFLGAVLVLAALAAAAAAHLFIDLIGDFALPHDSYDGMTHNARTLAFVVVPAIALGGILHMLWSALDRARESTGAFRALVRPILAIPAWRFAATIAILALMMVMAMESADALLNGVRIDDFADVFGGSILLGLAVTLVMSACIGFATSRIFRAVAAAHGCIVDLVYALIVGIRRACSSLQAIRTAFSLESFAAPISVLSTRAGKRAPPPLFG